MFCMVKGKLSYGFIYQNERSEMRGIQMIDYVKFENYRCFEITTVSFKDLTILVGKNNAGKSTIIEALRMISFVAGKAVKTTYKEPPYGFPISNRYKGIKVDVDKLKIDLRGIVYLYEDKYSKVKAYFTDGCIIEIYANSDIAFACVFSPDGENIKYKSSASIYNLNTINILPQIGLIKENERILEENRVVDYRDTYLSSRHFRNEMFIYKDEFWLEFKKIAEDSWEGLDVVSLNYNITESDFIHLMISDGHFMAEIGLMGSGLQMWLQIIWFLCRTKGCETIILDEPDVYMHPDLQRKILAMVKKRYSQVIIATHSVEIISDVDPENILVVDKGTRKMKYANNSLAVQQIIDNIGGIQNLSLLRIGIKKKCLFVEGEDIKILSKLYNKLYPETDIDLNSIPSIALKGFSNLSEAYGAANLFYQETEGYIKCTCILDRDYFPDEELKENIAKAESNHLKLHIWKRKEIENYLIVPKAIFRLTKRDSTEYEEFYSKFNDLVDNFKDYVMDQYAEKYRSYKLVAHSTSNDYARKIIRERWTTLENKINMIGGKELIKKINTWLKAEYKISSSINQLIKELHANEIDAEIVSVLEMII